MSAPEPGQQQEDYRSLAVRYVSALAGIVAVLGPTKICDCEFPSDCGLPYEAEEALRIAQAALAGRDKEQRVAEGG